MVSHMRGLRARGSRPPGIGWNDRQFYWPGSQLHLSPSNSHLEQINSWSLPSPIHKIQILLAHRVHTHTFAYPSVFSAFPFLLQGFPAQPTPLDLRASSLASIISVLLCGCRYHHPYFTNRKLRKCSVIRDSSISTWSTDLIDFRINEFKLSH